MIPDTDAGKACRLWTHWGHKDIREVSLELAIANMFVVSHGLESDFLRYRNNLIDDVDALVHAIHEISE